MRKFSHSPLSRSCGRGGVSSLLLLAALLAALAPGTPRAWAEPGAPAALAPTNPTAGAAAVKLLVSAAGVQRVTGASLVAAGANLAQLAPARLRLRLRGQDVALEIGGAQDGTLDPADEIRFYAPTPGDRWNAADVYWLTAEDAPGTRVAARGAGTGGTQRSTAVERGVVPGTARYDSTAPGPDGDHWFMADLPAGPGVAPGSVTLPLTPTLPLAGGSLTLRVTGSAYLSGPHELRASVGATSATLSWSGKGSWEQTFTIAVNATPAKLTLVSVQTDGVLVDAVAWQRAVSLDFGGKGAWFDVDPGSARYQLSGLPADAALYDVTDPRAPVRVALASPPAFSTDGGPAGQRYVLAGPSDLRAPAVQLHAAVDLAAPRSADALYIGPASLLASLEPLLAQRRAQGYAPAAVDVQAIYDSWSYGHVAPEAIRSFVRYAAATWPRRPVALTLVGDGSNDPLDRTRRGPSNLNLVPPYLAMVDPWLGETACETCYARLDADDPLADPLPDLLIGRLPAKSPGELAALVAKIVGYETAPGGQEWRTRQVYIADNHVEADGTIDRAGDFAQVADDVVAAQPQGALVTRVYYDPQAAPGTPGRFAGALQAQAAAIDAIDAGAGVVTYLGHASMWQWASNPYTTPPDTSVQYGTLLSLYDPDSLSNGDRLPMVLSMTCLSSAFQTPAFSGTTLDERMLLNPAGGAVAVWGPTGLGVLHGHDALMRGFFGALRSGGGSSFGARDWRAAGALVQSGYVALYQPGGCCQDALRTFALLGDPLTPIRSGERTTFLPRVAR